MPEDRTLNVEFRFRSNGEVAITNVANKLDAVTGAAQKAHKSFLDLGHVMETAIGVNIAQAMQGLEERVLALPGELMNMAVKFGETSSEILRHADAAGMATDAYQAWAHAAEVVGIPQEKLSMQLLRLNVALATGAPALAGTGITLRQLGITSTDSGQAMLKLADYFEKSSNAAQKSAIAQALFGRGAVELIPILNRGSGEFATFTKHLEDMGLILSEQQLNLGAVANVMHHEFMDALKGIENQVSAGLETGFIALWSVVTKGAEQAGGVFKVLGQIIGNVVGVVAGFLGAMFGIKDIGAQVSQALKDAGAYQGVFADNTQQSTGVVQENSKALNEQLKAYNASIDAQIHTIDLQTKEIDETRRLRNERRQATDDARKVATDEKDLTVAAFEGNVTAQISLGDQLTADKQKQADDQQTAAEDAHKNQLSDAKQALQDEKTAYAAMIQSKIDALNVQTLDVASNMGKQGDFMKGFASVADGIAKGLDKTWTNTGATIFNALKATFDNILALFSGNAQPLIDEANQLGKAIGDGAASGFVSGFAKKMLDQEKQIPILGLFASQADQLNTNIEMSKIAQPTQKTADYQSGTAASTHPALNSPGLPASHRGATIYIDARGASPTETEAAVNRALARAF